MGHVDDTLLAPARMRYGEPRVLQLEQPVLQSELDLVVASGQHGRRHDITFFAFNGDRLALIRKPQFAPGVWRPPSGGIKPGEALETGTEREALEEIGAAITLVRYVLRADVRFVCDGDGIDWHTHVFAATTAAEELAPRDTVEIAAARWGTLEELGGPIRKAALATGRGLWRYRVGLHDAMTHELRRLGLPHDPAGNTA
jgi:ADP-ribose pyrophosphatase YjhB (NUDIX family)